MVLEKKLTEFSVDLFVERSAQYLAAEMHRKCALRQAEDSPFILMIGFYHCIYAPTNLTAFEE